MLMRVVSALCCSAAFLKERLFDQSDAYRVHVCERSGLIAVANLKKQTFYSQIYKTDSSIVQVSRLLFSVTHLLSKPGQGTQDVQQHWLQDQQHTHIA